MNIGYIEHKISASVMGIQCDYHLALTRVKRRNETQSLLEMQHNFSSIPNLLSFTAKPPMLLLLLLLLLLLKVQCSSSLASAKSKQQQKLEIINLQN
jgi:hypothetical protein